ncbi:MAG TPA: calcium-binding protein [Candidatus Omnitrophota bacterium]|nr:calcium-binding protein [Candidatus Omnitrophota bacterium]
MATNPLTSAATNTDMKWAFPNLVNPTIIDLSKTGGQDWWQFRADEDVIFIGADSVRTANKLQTDGGRNIVVLGGEYQPQYDSRGATLHFLNVHGSVHVEGVKIDSTKASQDGIAVAGAPGKQPDVTVQNTVITGIHGTEGGVHGDVFQTHGPVGNMRFYNITADTSYQGFFIAPQYSPGHKSADFENVNLSYNGGSGHTYQYWFVDGSNQTPYPVTLKNVYATERSGMKAEDSSVWPKASMGAVRVGDQITWPGYPYKGAITVGEPAKDFATDANIGLNFKADGVKDATTGTIPPVDGTPSPSTPPAPAPSAEPTKPDGVAETAAPTNWINATDAKANVAGTDGADQLAGVEGAADAGLAGGKGDDTYIVDMAADKVVEAVGAGTDKVVSYASTYTLSANVENLELGGTANSAGIGNASANIITGNDGANLLKGMDGNDMLVGGKGNDVLDGGNGQDLMVGGLGNDTIVISRSTDVGVEKSGEGVDTVKSYLSYSLGKYAENLELLGQAKNATGNDWHNKLTGNDLANVINGKGGNDVIAGGKGADVITTGAGKDSVVFKSLAEAGDVVKDFKLGEDTLNVTALLKSIGSASTSPATDGVLAFTQQGANTVVTVKETKLVTLENVDAHDVQATADHWA